MKEFKNLEEALTLQIQSVMDRFDVDVVYIKVSRNPSSKKLSSWSISPQAETLRGGVGEGDAEILVSDNYSTFDLAGKIREIPKELTERRGDLPGLDDVVQNALSDEKGQD